METSKKSNGETLFDLTSYAADTPANPSQPPAKGTAQTTHDTSGLGSEKPLASYDLNTQSWKMCEDTFLLDSTLFSGKWPASGMTQNGKLFQQPQWVPHTSDNESLLWPTPTTQEVEHPQAELTPTGRRKSKNGTSSHSLGLADAVQKWPTPQARDYKGPSGRSLKGTEKDLPMAVGGSLNPMWVEWLMGFPLGWTDLED